MNLYFYVLILCHFSLEPLSFSDVLLFIVYFLGLKYSCKEPSMLLLLRAVGSSVVSESPATGSGANGGLSDPCDIQDGGLYVSCLFMGSQPHG